MNYQTKRIQDMVKLITNDAEVSIFRWTSEERPEPKPLGMPLIDQLETLFNLANWSIIFETISSFDDDGGPSYTAYLTPNKDINNWYQMHGESRDGYDIELMRYITNPRNNVICVWAGPY